MRTQGVMMIKFQMGNTMFTQDFVVCDDLVRPMIIGRDFTVSNYIGVALMRQGMKKVTHQNCHRSGRTSERNDTVNHKKKSNTT